MKKTSRTIILILCLLFLLSGCSSWTFKKDRLVLVENKNKPDENFISNYVKVSEFQTLFEGILLYYNEQDDSALYSIPADTQNDENRFSLYLYSDEKSRRFFDVSSLYPEARADKNTSYVAFKESNLKKNTSALYWTNEHGENKTRISEDVREKYLAWDMTQDGTIIYVDSKNVIEISRNNRKIPIYTMAKEFQVNKIFFAEDLSTIYLTASTSQTASVLYRIDLANQNRELIPIDINVSDFAVSEEKGLISYIKTTSSTQFDLFMYEHSSGIRKYILSNFIEKLSFSPSGEYLAFATKMTEGVPTQSVWILESGSDVPMQLTANTKLESNIFWTENERGIVFSTSLPDEGENETKRKYTTQKLTFSISRFDVKR